MEILDIAFHLLDRVAFRVDRDEDRGYLLRLAAECIESGGHYLELGRANIGAEGVAEEDEYMLA